MNRHRAVIRAWARKRDKLRDRPVADFVYRVGVGVVGLVVLAVSRHASNGCVVLRLSKSA